LTGGSVLRLSELKLPLDHSDGDLRQGVLKAPRNSSEDRSILRVVKRKASTPAA